jgi:hypothetical protein
MPYCMDNAADVYLPNPAHYSVAVATTFSQRELLLWSTTRVAKVLKRFRRSDGALRDDQRICGDRSGGFGIFFQGSILRVSRKGDRR